MVFLIQKKMLVKILGAFLILLQILIDILLNLIPIGEYFSIRALLKSPAFWILISSILVYIAVYFYIESPDKKSNKKNKTRFVDPKLKKALVDKGIYDVAAETVGECIKTGNYKKFKNVKKMIKDL